MHSILVDQNPSAFRSRLFIVFCSYYYYFFLSISYLCPGRICLVIVLNTLTWQSNMVLKFDISFLFLALIKSNSSIIRMSCDELFPMTQNICEDLLFSVIKDYVFKKNLTSFCFLTSSFYYLFQEDSYVTKSFSEGLDSISSVEKDNGEDNVTDVEDVSSCLKKTVERFQLRNNILAENFERFSFSTDEFIATLLRKLKAIRDEIVTVVEHTESFKQKANNLEIYKQEQENTIAILENDLKSLLSACTDATRELQFEVKNNLLELSSVPELEDIRHYLSPERGVIAGEGTEIHEQALDGSNYGKTAEMLSVSIRKVKALIKQFESTSEVAASTIEDLQNKLTEARSSSEKAMEERDLGKNRISKLDVDIEALQNKLAEARTTSEKAMEERELGQNRISKLDADIEALQNSCSKLTLRLEDYQAKEDKFKEKEAEAQILYNTLHMKEQGKDLNLFFLFLFPMLLNISTMLF